jgi:hypothetical protein
LNWKPEEQNKEIENFVSEIKVEKSAVRIKQIEKRMMNCTIKIENKKISLKIWTQNRNNI